MSEKALKIIQALGIHEDNEAITLLRDLGTNSSREDVREETIKALIKRNSTEALKVIVADKGKGINDLNMKVAIGAVNNLMNIKDKTELLNILNETVDSDLSEEIKLSARSLRALITLSE